MPAGYEKHFVLVCPLDWGLGHATRCVPVIRKLQQKGFTVLLGGNGESLKLLQYEFPHLSSCTIPGMKIRYGKGEYLLLQAILHFPLFMLQIMQEHRAVRQILRHHPVEFIISDNRYGVWSRKVKNILITHQLRPYMPAGLGWARGMAAAFIRLLCKPFGEIWIPDSNENPGLSGDLSASLNNEHQLFRHTGILSRLQPDIVKEESSSLPDVFVIISGPEPQRSIFERLVCEKFSGSSCRVYIMRGKPLMAVTDEQWKAAGEMKEIEGVFFRNHLPAEELTWYLQRTPLIIARSGYSTLMDLARLGRTALLIPTPGQPEQEYLGRRMQHLGWFCSAGQKDFPELEFSFINKEKEERKLPLIIYANGEKVLLKEMELRLQKEFSNNSVEDLLEPLINMMRQ